MISASSLPLSTVPLTTVPLLSVDKLSLSIKTDAGPRPLVQDIQFSLFSGKTQVLLGESGSGKSLTALSILQLLPANIGFGRESRILFSEKDLLSLTEFQMRSIRGSQIAMIFQEPMTSLNPVMTISEQIQEVIRLHQKILNRTQQKNYILSLLDSVKIQDPKRVAKSYPHELSGGMKQRVMIAMALSSKPKILIADEPTTALDITTQKQILVLLKQLQAEYNMAILFITHDLEVAKTMGDTVAIMQGGKLIEQGVLTEVIQSPREAYTQQLINAKPQKKLSDIPMDAQTVLAVEDISVHFPIKSEFLRRTTGIIPAVDNVSFKIRSGETLALVGESGSGKTTLAKTILALNPPTAGKVEWLGFEIASFSQQGLRKNRSEVQMIFQDPFSALDPRFRVLDSLLEGMKALEIGSDEAEREERIDYFLDQVGLIPEHKYRYPHEFSGGQRQRICIARALCVGPRLIVCDEPTSSLDRSIAAEIIDLFIGLQEEYELSYLFITHNLPLVRTMAHTVAVMLQGKIVEYGKACEVMNNPQHAYTQQLLTSC